MLGKNQRSVFYKNTYTEEFMRDGFYNLKRQRRASSTKIFQENHTTDIVPYFVFSKSLELTNLQSLPHYGVQSPTACLLYYKSEN